MFTELERASLEKSLVGLSRSLSLSSSSDDHSVDIYDSDQNVGSIHVARLQPATWSVHEMSSLCSAQQRITMATVRSPGGRHLLWIRFSAAGPSDTQAGAVMAYVTANLAALAHTSENHFVAGVCDFGNVVAACKVLGALLTSKLHVPKGTLLEAEAWGADTRPQDLKMAGGSLRWVRAAGLATPLFDAIELPSLKSIIRDGASSTVLRLFAGERVPTDIVKAVDGGRIFDCLARTGAIQVTGTYATSSLRCTPHDNLWVLSDPVVPEELHSATYLDPLWEAPALARLLPSHSIPRSLDIGCGAGLLALRLATFSDTVTAVDINPRAIVIGQLNAAINERSNIVWKRGDLFEPVEMEERFDAVVFNSPTDREGGQGQSLLLAGEAIIDRFLSRLPSIMSDRCWCLVNMGFDTSRIGKVLDRFKRAFGPMADRYDFAFIRNSSPQPSDDWVRGLVLVAGGNGRERTLIGNYWNVWRPIITNAPFSMQVWLDAIAEVVEVRGE
jgi:SAM-dependent methyltransferase